MTKQITTDLNIQLKKALAQLDKYEKQFVKLKGKINETKQKQKEFAQQSNKGLQAATKSLKNFAAGFIGLAVAVNILRKSIKTIADFEKAIANLSAITGATGKDLDFYKEKAIEMANASTLAAKDVVEAFKLVGSAVPELLKSKEALAEVTKNAIILSEAAGIDLNLAAKALGETLNQFRLPAQEAARVINTLAAASQLGAKEIPFVNEALAKFAGNARSMGISVEESVAAIETLGKVIPQAEIAGTNLRAIFLKMDLAAEKQGRTINSLAEELELLAPIVNNTTKLTKQFELRNVLAIRTLIESRDEFKILTEAITGTNTATEQAAINTDTLTASWTRLGNLWGNLILEGSALGGALKTAINAINLALINLTTTTEQFDKQRIDKILSGSEKSAKETLKLLRRVHASQIKNNQQAIDELEVAREKATSNRRKATLAEQIREAKELRDFGVIMFKIVQERLNAIEMAEFEALGEGGEDAEGDETKIAIDNIKNLRKAVNDLTKARQLAVIGSKEFNQLTDDRNKLQKRLLGLLRKTVKEEDEIAKATKELIAETLKIRGQTSFKIIKTIEEEGEAKLKALRAEFNADLLSVTQKKATAKAKTDTELAITIKFKADEKRIGFETEQAIFDHEDKLRDESNVLVVAAANFNISEARREADAAIDEARRAADAIANLKIQAVNTANIAINNLLQASINNTRNAANEEISIARDKASNKISFANLSADEIARINNELDTEIAKIQKEAADRAKLLAILQATIDFAAGVISIWAQNAGTPIVGVGISAALTALLATTYATQLAIISSQSFEKGTESAPGGLTQLHKDEQLWIPQKAVVFNKNAVNKYNDAIIAMNEGNFEELFVDKKGLVQSAKKYEEDKENGFADNIANSMIMQLEMKGVQTELYELNKKENWTHYILEKTYEHITGKKLL